MPVLALNSERELGERLMNSVILVICATHPSRLTSLPSALACMN